MAKKITPMQQEYVQNHPELSVEVLAKTTGLSVESVQSLQESKPSEPTPEPAPQTKTAKAVYQQGRGTDKNKGVRVLTPSAAQAADEDRAKYRKGGVSRKYEGAVAKINPEEN